MSYNVPTFDPFSFAPLSKSAIGFDSVIRKLADLTESAAKLPGYPPYNILKETDNQYSIEVALAGFKKEDVSITLQEGVLTIVGESKTESSEYLHKGIADRSFTRKFTLANDVEVRSADLENGLLQIKLERVIPEEKKLRQIPIGNSGPQLLNETAAAKVA